MRRGFASRGQTAITKVRENPYALAREVTGIGFHIADRIAAAMGVEPLSPCAVSPGKACASQRL